MVACRAVVTGVATTARDDDLVGRVVTSDDVDWAAQHVVVVVLPLSDATRHVVDAALPGAGSPTTRSWSTWAAARCSTPMPCSPRPDGCRFALDVTDPEPLPDGHPLWTAPGVLVTPHIAGGTTAMLPRIAALVRDQLERLRDGRPLRNVVAR